MAYDDNRPKSLFTELDEAIDRHQAKKKAEAQKKQQQEKDQNKNPDNPLL